MIRGVIRNHHFCYNSLEIHMDMVVKMFDKLKPKIVKSKNDGLESLL